jgi:hypothetical protein
MRTTSPASATIRLTKTCSGVRGARNMMMSPGVGFPNRYASLSTTSRS